jgi:plastocyanin
MHFRVVVVSLMLGWVGVMCGGCASSSSGVAVRHFAFHPDHLVVRTGKSIEVANHDEVLHTFTADDGSFNTGSIGAGKSRAVTFTKAGTYLYHCNIHVSMHGTVQVTG